MDIEEDRESEEKDARKTPKHVVGGFSVVLRLPEQGIAYRLQPMETFKAGMTWVAFHETVAHKSLDTDAVDKAMAEDAIFEADRSLILGPGKPSVRAWEQTNIATCYQASRCVRET